MTEAVEKQEKVTADVVAARVGVSKWTVIRALTQKGRISEETRKRVLEVAGELNYEPNLLARSLATKRSHQVAILIDDFANPYMLPSLGYLVSRLQDEGLLAVVINVNENFSHLKAITNARQLQMDAIVSFGVSFSPKSVIDDLAMNSGVSIFVLARESTIDHLPSIFTDAAPAVHQMGNYLFEKGYRRPVFFGGPKPLSTALGRQSQYQAFWASKTIAMLPEISVSAYDFESAKQTVRDYFDQRFAIDRPDILICENDILAIAAIDVAKYERGLKIPTEIGIVGFDDINLAGAAAYGLTTVQQPYKTMIDSLVEMILRRKVTQSLALEGSLIVRSSA